MDGATARASGVGAARTAVVGAAVGAGVGAAAGGALHAPHVALQKPPAVIHVAAHFPSAFCSAHV